MFPSQFKIEQELFCPLAISRISFFEFGFSSSRSSGWKNVRDMSSHMYVDVYIRTRNAGPKCNEGHRGNGIFNAECASEIRRNIPDNRCDDTNTANTDDEAQITTGYVCNRKNVVFFKPAVNEFLCISSTT